MDILRRSIAPITAEAWGEIDARAREIFAGHLSARRVVDVEGPHGWDFAAVPLGRLELPADHEKDGVKFGVHKVQPLTEVRIHFELDIWELDNTVRGARDIDLSALEDAARKIAAFEEEAVYYGFKPGGINGLKSAAGHKPLPCAREDDALMEAVSRGMTGLVDAGIDGPYALVADAATWRYVNSRGKGYPLKRQLERLLDKPLILSPTAKDSFLLSTRGGDFVLTLGHDLSIGYASHDKSKVRLYLTESFTFAVLEPAAVAPLEVGKKK